MGIQRATAGFLICRFPHSISSDNHCTSFYCRYTWKYFPGMLVQYKYTNTYNVLKWLLSEGKEGLNSTLEHFAGITISASNW